MKKLSVVVLALVLAFGFMGAAQAELVTTSDISLGLSTNPTFTWNGTNGSINGHLGVNSAFSIYISVYSTEWNSPWLPSTTHNFADPEYYGLILKTDGLSSPTIGHEYTTTSVEIATPHAFAFTYYEPSTLNDANMYNSIFYGSVQNKSFTDNGNGTATFQAFLNAGAIYHGFEVSPQEEYPIDSNNWDQNFTGYQGYNLVLNLSNQTGNDWTITGGTMHPTPLPGTLLLLGSGLAGLVVWRKRRQASLKD